VARRGSHFVTLLLLLAAGCPNPAAAQFPGEISGQTPGQIAAQPTAQALRGSPMSPALAHAAFAAAAAAAGPREAPPSAAESSAFVELPASNAALHILVGRSLVLTSTTPLRRLYVGNPSVLQTYTSGLTEIVLTPRVSGVSSLIVWDRNGGERFYTVYADLDAASLRAALREAFPGSGISAEVRDGKIYLAGSASSEAVSESAAKLAQSFGKEVVNSVHIAPPRVKQVELKLRIVEVDRTKLEQFGVNIFSGGSNVISTSTEQYNTGQSGVGTNTLTTSDPLNLLFYNFRNAVGASIKDLQQRDVLEVLAEPTLVTISGVAARFLSGGEFPVPVVQGGVGTTAAITIIFRPYGVKVDFTPTVNEDNSIRLKIAPEVSSLDYSNSVTISGFTIPALSTRRAETEIQIRDGQTFMVSGLLDRRTTDNFSKIPGIGNIPILGELFKSKNTDHSVIELVLIVTATIIDPLSMHETPAEPKMSSPLMQSGQFDAADKARKAAAPSSAPAAPPVPEANHP
jgi:pilus assembly protein CpaC